MLYRILNHRHFAARGDYRRLWLEPGRPVSLSSQCVVTLLYNRMADGRQPELVFSHYTKGLKHVPIIPNTTIDAFHFTSQLIVPRALEQRDSGYSTRLMIEVLALDVCLHERTPA